MCHKKVFVVVVLAVIASETIAKVAPPYIIPCKDLTDDCLKKTVQTAIPSFVKGYPELGLESLDPLKQKLIKLDLPGNVKIELSDGAITGFRKCKVEDVKYVLEKNTAEMNLLCTLTIKGKYKANGRLLIVSLNGDGDAKVKATDVRIKAKIQFQDEVRDGVTYYTVKNYDLQHSFDGIINYQLTNLFKGNPEISQAVLTFINENWKQLASEFGDPIVKKITKLVFDVITKFFNSIPKSELF